jgi:Undecaprenyl-phosphate galactose phosphotransferase WbaP
MIELDSPSSPLLQNVVETRLEQTASQSVVVRAVQWSHIRHWHYWFQRVRFAAPLLLIDSLVSSFFLVVASVVFRWAGYGISNDLLAGLCVSQISATLIVFAAFGLYRNVGMHPVEELERVVTASCLALFVTGFVLFSKQERLGFDMISLFVLSSMWSIFVLPSVRHILRCRLGKTRWWRIPVVVISHSSHADGVVSELEKEGHLGWRPIGLIQDFQQNWNRPEVSPYFLGDHDDLPEIIQKKNVFWGMVDASNSQASDVQSLLDRHHKSLPHIVSFSGNAGDSTLFLSGLACGSLPGVCYHSNHCLLVPKLIKRLMDFVISAAVILFLSPIIAVLIVAVRLSGPGPVFYSQQRIGLNGKAFRIWKFRSMVQNADQVLDQHLSVDKSLQDEWRRSQKLTNDPRITTIGRLLRKTSLDELPQLWNVLNGTMSLVGPRPIIRSEIEKYGDVYWLYTQTKPGITGLWQVSGRNHTTYNQRLQYDSFYIRNWSFWLDWYILLKTIRVVVLCEGAY